MFAPRPDALPTLLYLTSSCRFGAPMMTATMIQCQVSRKRKEGTSPDWQERRWEPTATRLYATVQHIGTDQGFAQVEGGGWGASTALRHKTSLRLVSAKAAKSPDHLMLVTAPLARPENRAKPNRPNTKHTRTYLVCLKQAAPSL